VGPDNYVNSSIAVCEAKIKTRAASKLNGHRWYSFIPINLIVTYSTQVSAVRVKEIVRQEAAY